MSHQFVTDDHASVQVAMFFGLRKKMMAMIEKDGKKYWDVDHEIIPEIIGLAINEGMLKLHLELDEWYYHATEKGMTFLQSICTCCGEDLTKEEKSKWFKVKSFLRLI